jgi:hypothetical protein
VANLVQILLNVLAIAHGIEHPISKCFSSHFFTIGLVQHININTAKIVPYFFKSHGGEGCPSPHVSK